MCSTIQNMQFYLRTGFGDLSEYAGVVGNIKTQGMCQGNGAASTAWMVMSITIINAHKKKGHGVRVMTPISKLDLHLAGSLFVNNTDLMHLDTHKSETALEAMEALQDAVTNWGCLLIAMGGVLKPVKYFYHLISFSWKPDGTWRYDDNHKNPVFQLHVPLANGDMAPIEHLSVDSPSKTLGSMTCPSGSCKGTFTQM